MSAENPAAIEFTVEEYKVINKALEVFAGERRGTDQECATAANVMHVMEMCEVMGGM